MMAHARHTKLRSTRAAKRTTRASYVPTGQRASPRSSIHRNQGIKSTKNTLNDLTGKEWVYFLSSVISTAYPTKGKDSFSHELRKQHPSPKPPQLLRDIVEFFTKRNQWVLDPFMGVGGTLLGAALANRRGVGIDINKKYLHIYSQVCKQEKIPHQITLCGDSRNLNSILKPSLTKREIPNKYDLILTDPPYANMMNKKRTISLKNGKNVTPFSNSSHDIGNLSHEKFLQELKIIIKESLKHLKNKKYLVVFAKDLQPKTEHHNLLHADIVTELSSLENLRFRGYRIWFDKTQTLYPLGYPHAFVANQFHQFILIFRKEEK